jgi:hypothetical protein
MSVSRLPEISREPWLRSSDEFGRAGSVPRLPSVAPGKQLLSLGHLHHMGKSGVEEHQLPVSKSNPAQCAPAHDCGKHDKKHKHGPACGHEAVPHGDHVDYLVEGHLHHPHGDHCDDHGQVK